MSEDFLSPDELLKRLESFKGKWYGIAEKSEGLSNYKSGFGADFEKAIFDIHQRVNSCKKDIEFFSLSVEHHIPKSRRRIKDLVGSIIDRLSIFEDVLQQDIDSIESYNSLKPRLARLERELTEVEKRLQMVSEQAERAFKEYKEAKKTHEEEVQNVKATADRILSQMRETFSIDIKDKFKGYDLVTKVDTKKIDPQALFTSLQADDDFVDKIEIVPKGLSGLISGKGSELEVRKVLLRYKAEEINNEVRPVLEDEKKKLRKFESESLHIKNMRKTAQRLDEDKEEIEQEKEGVIRKINQLRSKGDEVMGKFFDYEDILDLREGYLKGFNEIDTEKKKLFKLIEDALKKYEPPEPDLEKRELKDEIRTLTKEIKKLGKINLKFKNEKEDITKKYTSTKLVLTQRSKEIRRLVATIREQENTKKGLDDEATEITNKMEATSKRLSQTKKKLVKLEKKIEGLKLDIKKEKEEKAGLEKENVTVKAELQKKLQKLEKSTKKYKKWEKDVKKTRKSIKELTVAHALLETKYKTKVREVKKLKSTIKRIMKVGKTTLPPVEEERDEEERIVSKKIEALRNREGE